MRYKILLWLAYCLFLFLPISIAHSDGKNQTTFVEELAPELTHEALSKIPEFGRKLLALRSYERARSSLKERWSWTAKEIEEYNKSEQKHALLDEVEAVKTHFAISNPGYSLFVNTKVRSLDVQIMRWNNNKSVGTSAIEILARWRDKFGPNETEATNVNATKARQWLRAFKPTTRANLAAPGLTRHGRASAIDFQIMENGKIIAGANSKQIQSVWKELGWSAKLKSSIIAAGPSFKGPLLNPFEPWHYDYEPEANKKLV